MTTTSEWLNSRGEREMEREKNVLKSFRTNVYKMVSFFRPKISRNAYFRINVNKHGLYIYTEQWSYIFLHLIRVISFKFWELKYTECITFSVHEFMYTYVCMQPTYFPKKYSEANA